MFMSQKLLKSCSKPVAEVLGLPSVSFSFLESVGINGGSDRKEHQ
jgi:hypothetical protein